MRRIALLTSYTDPNTKSHFSIEIFKLGLDLYDNKLEVIDPRQMLVNPQNELSEFDAAVAIEDLPAKLVPKMLTTDTPLFRLTNTNNSNSNPQSTSNIFTKVYVFGDDHKKIQEKIQDKPHVTNLGPKIYPKPKWLKGKKVDLGIPFYNDPHTLHCLESIEKHRSHYLGRVFVVDDCGGNQELAKKVKDWCDDRKDWVTHIQNADNLGFVQSSNRAMEESENDIILLNTDTTVSANWIEKILTIAYCEPRIATVTPLTNNASYFSLPYSQEQNEDDDPQESMLLVDAIFNSLHAKNSTYNIKAHSGHGFCLFINRKLLDEIGTFDEKAFGKGYGEEVDLCLRAHRAGWSHRVAVNTYVYHIKAQSFSLSRDEHNKGKNKFLREKFPELEDLVEDFTRSDELSEIRKLFNPLKLGEIKYQIRESNGIKYLPEISLAKVISEELERNHSRKQLQRLNPLSSLRLILFDPYVRSPFISIFVKAYSKKIIRKYSFILKINIFSWNNRRRWIHILKSNQVTAYAYSVYRRLKQIFSSRGQA